MKKDLMCKQSKNSTGKENFYLPILNALGNSTNLSNIQEDLKISKQQLNYYLRNLKKQGIVHNPSYGVWELTKESKNPTKYGELLKKDTIRGHGYIINIGLPKNIPNWASRLSTIKEKGINHELVGALKTTPRIKVLGRKVWLCNDHLRIYDKSDESYYGENAIQSRIMAFREFKKIINCLENKLGVKLNPENITFQKEHYALIKNDLAIEENKKGNIIRVSDEDGEWLLIDDSLGMGGELENTGKKALVTNIPMQKWWNEQKESKFQVTPKFIMESFQNLIEDRKYYAENMRTHVEAIKTLSQTVKELREEICNLKKVTKV